MPAWKTNPLPDWEDGPVTAAMMNDRVKEPIEELRTAISGYLAEITDSGTTNVNNNVWTKIPCVVANRIVGAGWDHTSGKVEAPVTGWYVLTGNVTFDQNGTGRRLCRITDGNGNAYNPSAIATPAVTSGRTSVPVNLECQINEGQTIQIEAYQGSGGTLGVSEGRLTARLIIPDIS